MTPMPLPGMSTPSSVNQTQSNLVQTRLTWWTMPKAAKPAGPNVPVTPSGTPYLAGSQGLDRVNTTSTMSPVSRTANTTSHTATATTRGPTAKIPRQNHGTSTSASPVIVALPAHQHSRRKIIDIPLARDATEDDELVERPLKRRVISRPNLPVVSRPSAKKEPSTPTEATPRETITTPTGIEKTAATRYPNVPIPQPVVVVVESPQKEKAARPADVRAKSTADGVQDYTTMEEKDAKIATRAAGHRLSRGSRGRGRVGRSRSIPFAGMEVEAPQRRARNVATRGGRGSARRGRITRTWQYFTQLRPQYLEFVCEWQGCPARLFNMDTMRRHMEIVHMRRLEMGAAARNSSASAATTTTTVIGGAAASIKYACLWTGCADTREDRKGVGREFDSVNALREHIEEDHMVPMSWHMGDGPVYDPDNRGPQVLRIGEPLPDYLFDPDGNQVTPDIRNQQIESVADKKARARRLRKFMADVIANLPDPPEDEEPQETLD